MKPTHRLFAASTTLAALLGVPALAGSVMAPPASLTVHVDGIDASGAMLPANSMCKATPDGKSTPAENLRPTISWSGAPDSTASYAIIVNDPDVPADFSKAGKDGQVIDADEPRQNFFHWALLDIPATVTSIPGGKSAAGTNVGTPAANDLAKYIPNPNNYGGACPPWNDARVHHYHFHVFALDEKMLSTTPPTTAKAAMAILKSSPHVLAEGEAVGTYTVNPSVKK
jgi:phosphatidylethanolamine-binding protein (PEBP) family uncharacterized protein